MEDNRIHLLLYFFEGHHLKHMEFKVLKTLQSYVNIIPVVAKADSFTQGELQQFKMGIIAEAADRNINFFDCSSAIDSLTDVNLYLLTFERIKG